MMTTKEIALTLHDMAFENWHIHSSLSRCANPEMTPENIITMSEQAKLTRIAIVDHHHPGEEGVLEKTGTVRSGLAERETPVKVTVGAELSAFGPGDYADPLNINSYVDYRLYACNHYHISTWKQPDTTSPEGYAQFSMRIIRELISTERADCIAHPLVASYIKQYKDNQTLVTSQYPDSDLMELFEMSKTYNVAWEINIPHLMNDLDFAGRYIRLAFDSGVTLKIGTDAHRLLSIDPKPQVERLIKSLNFL